MRVTTLERIGQLKSYINHLEFLLRKEGYHKVCDHCELSSEPSWDKPPFSVCELCRNNNLEKLNAEIK